MCTVRSFLEESDGFALHFGQIIRHFTGSDLFELRKWILAEPANENYVLCPPSSACENLRNTVATRITIDEKY